MGDVGEHVTPVDEQMGGKKQEMRFEYRKNHGYFANKNVTQDYHLGSAYDIHPRCFFGLGSG